MIKFTSSSNWFYIVNIIFKISKKYWLNELCPLYDNGSSLCAYEENNDLTIFFKDKMKI